MYPGFRFVIIGGRPDWDGLTGRVSHFVNAKAYVTLDKSPPNWIGWWPEHTFVVEHENVWPIDSAKARCSCGIFKWDCKFHKPVDVDSGWE